MFELVKKTMFTGLGLAYMTKEKIEERSKDLIEKWKLSEKEGKELMDELKKKSDEAKKEAQQHVEKLVEETLEKMNVATKDDLKNLEERLRNEINEATKTEWQLLTF